MNEVYLRTVVDVSLCRVTLITFILINKQFSQKSTMYHSYMSYKWWLITDFNWIWSLIKHKGTQICNHMSSVCFPQMLIWHSTATTLALSMLNFSSGSDVPCHQYAPCYVRHHCTKRKRLEEWYAVEWGLRKDHKQLCSHIETSMCTGVFIKIFIAFSDIISCHGDMKW